MFSTRDRCHYRSNQIAEVICQLRFPEILSIGTTAPAAFQDAIRDEFPQFIRRQDLPAPKITGMPGHLSLENQPGVINYQFSSADGTWRVNLTSRFISLTCNRYSSWEDFAKKLDKPLAGGKLPGLRDLHLLLFHLTIRSGCATLKEQNIPMVMRRILQRRPGAPTPGRFLFCVQIGRNYSTSS